MARAYAAFLALLLTGCPNPFAPACTRELGMRFTPAEPTLAVGQLVTASLELTSCGGRTRWRPQVTWRTEDTDVVSVEAATGRITALAVGDAIVYAVETAGSTDSQYYYFVKVR